MHHILSMKNLMHFQCFVGLSLCPSPRPSIHGVKGLLAMKSKNVTTKWVFWFLSRSKSPSPKHSPTTLDSGEKKEVVFEKTIRWLLKGSAERNCHEPLQQHQLKCHAAGLYCPPSLPHMMSVSKVCGSHLESTLSPSSPIFVHASPFWNSFIGIQFRW